MMILKSLFNKILNIKNKIDPLKPNKSILENCYLSRVHGDKNESKT